MRHATANDGSFHHGNETTEARALPRHAERDFFVKLIDLVLGYHSQLCELAEL